MEAASSAPTRALWNIWVAPRGPFQNLLGVQLACLTLKPTSSWFLDSSFSANPPLNQAHPVLECRDQVALNPESALKPVGLCVH